MWIYIVAGIAGVIGLFVLIVAMQPAAFRITRSLPMKAAPQAIFEQVNDLHKWEAWSPWEKMDPEMKRTYEGPAAGIGASYAWVGNKQVGEGRMTITDSKPPDLVRIRLEFLRPFTATNEVAFTFKPEGGSTLVSWDMTGSNNFMGKAFSLLMNMDKLVGSDFEKGLANLKGVVEGK